MALSTLRYRAALVVAALTIALAVTLRWETAVHEITGLASACTISSKIDCDTVQASVYARFAGISVSLWGAAGTLLLALWLVAARRRGGALVPGVAGLALFNLAVSLVFLYLSTAKVGAFCLYCIGMQAGALALALLVVPPAWRAARAGTEARGRPALLALLLAGVVGTLLFGGEAYAAQRSSLLKLVERPTGDAVRIDLSDTLIVGDPTTEHSVVVFFDLRCPHCRKCFHTAVEKQRKYPEDWHFIFKHWPLDVDCNLGIPTTPAGHEGACNAAAAGTGAALEGRSKDAMIYIFAQNNAYPQILNALGPMLGVDKQEWRTRIRSKPIWEIVARDIAEGDALRVTAVPTAFLNGRYVDASRIGTLVEKIQGQ